MTTTAEKVAQFRSGQTEGWPEDQIKYYRAVSDRMNEIAPQMFDVLNELDAYGRGMLRDEAKAAISKRPDLVYYIMNGVYKPQPK